jgi:hypothetical protein
MQCRQCETPAGPDDLFFCPACRGYLEDIGLKYWDRVYDSGYWAWGQPAGPVSTHRLLHHHVRADDNSLLHAFSTIGSGTAEEWAEWVAQATPYGSEARKLLAWHRDRLAASPLKDGDHGSSGLEEGPIFTSKRAGATALRNCVEKVHLYFMPPQKGINRAIGWLIWVTHRK